MKIEDLIDKTPAEFRPIVAQYGPALVAMTAVEFAAWLDLLLRGNQFAAWEAVCAKLDAPGLIAGWQGLGEKWDAANAANADRIDLQRSAALAVLKILLAAALAAVGI